MNKIILAAVALLAFAAPASAQYRGDYYGDRGYGGGGGWYDGREPYRRRGYDPYDDDQPRRYRRGEPAPYGQSRARPATASMCVTPRGSCRHAVPAQAGTPCECWSGGVATRGINR
jgi:hypothetical protein